MRPPLCSSPLLHEGYDGGRAKLAPNIMFLFFPSADRVWMGESESREGEKWSREVEVARRQSRLLLCFGRHLSSTRAEDRDSTSPVTRRQGPDWDRWDSFTHRWSQWTNTGPVTSNDYVALVRKWWASYFLQELNVRKLPFMHIKWPANDGWQDIAGPWAKPRHVSVHGHPCLIQLDSA